MLGLRGVIAEIDFFKGFEVNDFFLNKKMLNSYILYKPHLWTIKYT